MSPATAAILDTVASSAATETEDPAYACGVHWWNGTAESLNPSPASRRTTARMSAGRVGVFAQAAAAATGENVTSWVATSHSAAPTTVTAAERSAVVSRDIAPWAARSVPR